MVQAKFFQWRSAQQLGIVLILIFASLRFINLDTKLFWYDEVYTGLRLSGYTNAEVLHLNQTGERTFGSLKIFQCPSLNRGLADTLNGLVLDDSHPPLYFALLYLWTNWIGCTVAKVRLFSAVISFLTIPVAYIFIQNIFRSPPISILGTIFIANSPILLIYAQETRSYALFILLSLLSSIFLLKWIEEKRKKDLLLYGLICTAGLYCHTLYYLVIFGQVLYCVTHTPLDNQNENTLYDSHWIHRIRDRFQQNISLLVTVLISWLIFSLWLIRVIYLQGLTIRAGADYTWKIFPLDLIWKRLFLNITSLFYDFQNPLKNSIMVQSFSPFPFWGLGWGNIVIIVFISLLFLTGMWFTFYRKTYSYRGLMVYLMLPSFILLCKDLILGGSGSTIIRYQLVTVVIIYIALAFFLIELQQLAKKQWLRNGIIILISLLGTLQIYSDLVYLNSSTWWSKYGDYQLQEFAAIVNHAPKPIVLGQADEKEMVNLLKLSYILNSSTPFELVNSDKIPEKYIEGNYQIFWVPRISQSMFISS